MDNHHQHHHHQQICFLDKLQNSNNDVNEGDMSDRVCDWISDVNWVGFRIRVVSEYWDLQFKFKIWNVKFQIWVCHTEKIATLRCTKIEIN